MRKIELWPASVLTAALVVGGLAVAQPPGPARGIEQRPPISADDIVDWIMSFDKSKKGKVTKEDLPERMRHLIEKGDTNKDGALDRDEIRALAAKLEKEGFDPGGGIRTSGRLTSGTAFFRGPNPDQIEGVLDDLKLDAKKKDQAKAAVKAHQESVRKLMEQSRAELLQKMKEILSAEEFENFKAALDRPRGETVVNIRGVGAPGPGELERKLEQLQKDLDELRRELRR
jgi:hypothetical protein